MYLADDDVPTGAVYKTTDAGISWTSQGFTGRARDIVTDPLHPMRLFIAASAGAKVQVSEDDGATFSSFDSGMVGAGWVRDLKLAPGACHTLLLATTTGAYAEREAGCTLEADTISLSASAGGVLGLDISAYPENAGRWYIVLGSVTGTDGISAGGIDIPLTYDPYTLDTLTGANGGVYMRSMPANSATLMLLCSAAARVFMRSAAFSPPTTAPPSSRPEFLSATRWTRIFLAPG